MKLMIASDLHGSALYTRQLLEAFARERAQKLLLLGDLLYHGPRNDLPEGYAPKEVIELLNAYAGAILCVRGNCEAQVDQMVLNFPIMAEYCVLFLNGRTVYATHGHVYNMDAPLPMNRGELLFFGHTHVPCCVQQDGILYANPGSVSIPKQGSERGYLTLEGDKMTHKTLSGAVIACYDVEKMLQGAAEG